MIKNEHNLYACIMSVEYGNLLWTWKYKCNVLITNFFFQRTFSETQISWSTWRVFEGFQLSHKRSWCFSFQNNSFRWLCWRCTCFRDIDENLCAIYSGQFGQPTRKLHSASSCRSPSFIASCVCGNYIWIMEKVWKNRYCFPKTRLSYNERVPWSSQSKSWRLALIATLSCAKRFWSIHA